MPYIDSKSREFIRMGPNAIDTSEIETAGDLQYAIAIMIKDFMDRKGLRYQNCNDVMGALAGAQMEFYRKVVGPYESEKEAQNGGIY